MFYVYVFKCFTYASAAAKLMHKRKLGDISFCIHFTLIRTIRFPTKASDNTTHIEGINAEYTFFSISTSASNVELVLVEFVFMIT